MLLLACVELGLSPESKAYKNSNNLYMYVVFGLKTVGPGCGRLRLVGTLPYGLIIILCVELQHHRLHAENHHFGESFKMKPYWFEHKINM